MDNEPGGSHKQEQEKGQKKSRRTAEKVKQTAFLLRVNKVSYTVG